MVYGHGASLSTRTPQACLWEQSDAQPKIRRVIYTTNAIEILNETLRKVTRNRSAFPDDDSVYKIMYLAIGKASQKWTQPIRNWGLAINQFSIVFGDRVKL